jgi:hypothetical protein
MASEWRTERFGQMAILVRDAVLPSEAAGLPYIGLEHIGEGDLRLIDLELLKMQPAPRLDLQLATFYLASCVHTFAKWYVLHLTAFVRWTFGSFVLKTGLMQDSFFI